jgi:hypothetical protein
LLLPGLEGTVGRVTGADGAGVAGTGAGAGLLLFLSMSGLVGRLSLILPGALLLLLSDGLLGTILLLLSGRPSLFLSGVLFLSGTLLLLSLRTVLPGVGRSKLFRSPALPLPLVSALLREGRFKVEGCGR